MFSARRIRRRRAIAGTAAIGGAAYYAAKRGATAPQRERASSAPDEAPAPAVEPPDELKELTELREQGLLTEAEFAAEKKKLLGS